MKKSWKNKTREEKNKYYRDYRKKHLEKLRKRGREHAKKIYPKYGKKYRMNYYKAMQILRERHKKEFNKILKDLK